MAGNVGFCAVVLLLSQAAGSPRERPRLNYDDPKVEHAWSVEQRAIVLRYLAAQRLPTTGLQELPAWSLAPYIALWRSSPSSGRSVWVISGDLPTDYVNLASAREPREAVRAFALRWERAASNMIAGRVDPEVRIGKPENQKELGELLRKRAALLKDFAARDVLWQE